MLSCQLAKQVYDKETVQTAVATIGFKERRGENVKKKSL